MRLLIASLAAVAVAFTIPACTNLQPTLDYFCVSHPERCDGGTVTGGGEGGGTGGGTGGGGDVGGGTGGG
ncbi:MAG: hypothetical protein ACJ790_04115, partial [Myxococcaceae bacterium]